MIPLSRIIIFKRKERDKMNCELCKTGVKHTHNPCEEMKARGKCGKGVNPEQFPGVYWGEPWVFDKNRGTCLDCQTELKQLKEGKKTPTKLRMLLFEECERSCEGCCNKDWNLKELPTVYSYEKYEEIMLTGGEPMLEPDFVKDVVEDIRKISSASVYMYTAKVTDIEASVRVLDKLDGMTVTLHEQSDVAPFLEFIRAVNLYEKEKSLRVNIFKGIEVEKADLRKWVVKKDIEWIKNCPLPEDEVFMRF